MCYNNCICNSNCIIKYNLPDYCSEMASASVKYPYFYFTFNEEQLVNVLQLLSNRWFAISRTQSKILMLRPITVAPIRCRPDIFLPPHVWLRSVFYSYPLSVVGITTLRNFLGCGLEGPLHLWKKGGWGQGRPVRHGLWLTLIYLAISLHNGEEHG